MQIQFLQPARSAESGLLVNVSLGCGYKSFYLDQGDLFQISSVFYFFFFKIITGKIRTIFFIGPDPEKLYEFDWIRILNYRHLKSKEKIIMSATLGTGYRTGTLQIGLIPAGRDPVGLIGILLFYEIETAGSGSHFNSFSLCAD